MGRTANDAADGKRISEKTFRATYWKFREALLLAVISEPWSFGRAGHFLFHDRRLTRTGKAFLENVSRSDLFADHMKRHCPRLKSLRQRRLVLFEVVIRVFCNISVPKEATALMSLRTQSGEHLYPGNVLYEHLRRYLLKNPL